MRLKTKKTDRKRKKNKILENAGIVEKAMMEGETKVNKEKTEEKTEE